MQSRLGIVLNPKQLLLPKNNHWLKRITLVFAFVAFDFLSTLTFCRAPIEEANTYARVFMECFGMHLGLTVFVLVANLPIYMILSLNSHAVKLPSKIARIADPLIDTVFAWFIAGLHFSGGTSWFWCSQDLMRQGFGASLYLIMAFLFVKPHKTNYY